MARRIVNRREMREQYDAAERQKEEVETEEDEEEDEDEDEEEGEEAEADGEVDEEDEGSGGDDDDDDEPKPKKKKKAAVKVPKEKKPRARTSRSKVVRMKVVWGVFNNSNQRVAVYDYPKRKEADEHAAKLMSEKKSTFFVQPVKEPIEEKKEK